MNHINITFYLSWLCFLFSLFVFLWTYETVSSHFFPPLLFCLVVKNSFTILLIDTLEVTFFIINLSKCNITWQFNLFLDNARILEYFNICPFPNFYTIVSVVIWVISLILLFWMECASYFWLFLRFYSLSADDSSLYLAASVCGFIFIYSSVGVWASWINVAV